MKVREKICGKCFWHRKKDGKWICTNYCGKYKEETKYTDTCENVDVRK